MSFLSFAQLAKQYHPDTNKSAGAAEKFQEISEAYEVLYAMMLCVLDLYINFGFTSSIKE